MHPNNNNNNNKAKNKWERKRKGSKAFCVKSVFKSDEFVTQNPNL